MLCIILSDRNSSRPAIRASSFGGYLGRLPLVFAPFVFRMEFERWQRNWISVTAVFALSPARR